jgi:Kef-type K+ transport system membrane component KefB
MPSDLSSLHMCLLTCVGVAAIVGFYWGRGARKIKLPSILGYMLLGVVLGPSLLNMFNESSLERLSFITQIALGFVAFSIGSELSLSSLKRLGPGVISIILAESFAAFIVVSIAVYLLTRDLPMAIVFGAVAPASAPAGTVAVIQEYKAKGSLTKALYAVVGFDDGLAILIFGFAAAVAKNLLIHQAGESTGSLAAALTAPAREVALSLIIGGIIGFVFCLMVRKLHNPGDILIMVFGAIVLGAGLSARWNLSLILTNMVVGFTLANTRREALVHRVTSSLMDMMPLVFVLFFCLAGAHLQLSALPKLGLVGVVYILARTAGLIGGARLGAMVGHVEPKIKKYIGLGILSQAGVAIGLSLIVKHEFELLSAEYNLARAAQIGASVLTTITATCVFFEIVGPILTKVALKKAGEIPADN